MNAEAHLAHVFRAAPQQAIALCQWVQLTACLMAELEEVAMPLSYTEWRDLVGYPPGCWGWDGEQLMRAAFYAAQPGCGA